MFIKIMKMTLVYTLMLCTLGVVCGDKCEKKATTAEAQIRETILCNYDTQLRPVKNQSKAINVGITLFPTMTYFIDQASAITLHVYLGMVWIDEYLVWNDTAYNISSIKIWNDKIWMPDIVSFNTENTPSYRDVPNECEVYFYGEVLCLMYTSYKAFCESDFQNWPYGRTICSLQFRTWFDHGHTIQLSGAPGEGFDMKMYKPSLQWDFKITNVSFALGSESPDTWDPLNITFPSANYTMILKQHSAVISANIVAPMMVMPVLTMIAMMMGVETFERVYLLTISLFGHFWYLKQILSWYIPYNEGNSALILVLCRNSVIVTAAVLVLTSPLKKLLVKMNEVPKLVYWTIELSQSTLGLWILYPTKKLDDMSPFVGQDVGEVAAQLCKRNNEEWTYFVRIFDRITFYAVFLAYCAMVLSIFI